MSDPASTAATPTPAPPTSAPPTTAPARRHRQWVDEWGLRFLALLLAVLLWTLTRAGIEGESLPIYVQVRAEAIHKEHYVAFPVEDPNKPITMILQGTTSERADAKARFGDKPTIVVKVGDIPQDRDEAVVPFRWPQDDQALSVPFRSSLVKSVSSFDIRVFRLTTQRAVVKPPAFTNVPKGFEARPLVQPDTVLVQAPYNVLGETIEPDPIDVGHLFEGGKVPEGAQEFPLSFDAWRTSPALTAYRAKIALPEVKVSVTFVAIATHEIENVLAIVYPGTASDTKADYEWTPDSALPGIGLDGQRFTGLFKGSEADLDALQRQAGSWFYTLTVPAEKLDRLRSGEKTEETVRVPLGWFLSDTLRKLNVQFVPPEKFGEVQVTVKKRR